MEIVKKYFDDFSPHQLDQFGALQKLYTDWNEKINVISRKDIESLYEKHVLHSLSIATTFDFVPGTKIIDIGTGGGFPGIPLAIFFPDVEFLLVDSIAKKLKVVDGVANELQLNNVKTRWTRIEDVKEKLHFDFAVSRAVAPLKDLWNWAKPVVKKTGINEMANGLICLKGGDLHQEISESGTRPMLWKLSEFFDTEFFETKSMVYVNRSSN
jgi:16S rRNA (guanine527-N7)-methyltransferase